MLYLIQYSTFVIRALLVLTGLTLLTVLAVPPGHNCTYYAYCSHYSYTYYTNQVETLMGRAVSGALESRAVSPEQ